MERKERGRDEEMKTILCNKCHKTVEVSDVWKFKQCSNCLAKQREKEALKPKSSFSPEVKQPSSFMSFEDYRKHWKNASWKQFMEEKARFDENKRLEKIAVEKHEQVPIYDESCRITREMLMGVRVKDSLTVGIHFSDCGLCRRWYATYREEHPPLRGFNLWADSEPVTKEEQANNERDKSYNEILRQELNR
jgi:hypothetical protein